MKAIIFFVSVMLTSLAAAAEPVAAVVGAEFWMNPRHGETLIKLESLRKVVRTYFDAEGDAKLRISHPASESGELWGGEMQAWLVSLGIASDRIEQSADYAHDDAVEIILESVAAKPVIVKGKR
jgi:hypothetical protein